MKTGGQTLLSSPESKASIEHHNKLVIEAQNSDDIMQMIPILKLVLQKPIQARSLIQNKLLDKFTKTSSFFNTITNYTSYDVSRNLLKCSKIYDIIKHRTLIQKGRYISDIIVLLHGKLGIVEADQLHKLECLYKEQQIYKKIIENSYHNLRDIKRRMKQVPQNQTQTQFKTSKASMIDLTILNTIQNQEQILNLPSLIEGKNYEQSIVTCQPSTILTINAKIFYENLSQFVKKSKHDKISAFKKLQFFSRIDDVKLTHLVDDFPLIALKKGQFVYKEGDQLTQMYFLVKGSIKITKVANIFKQNPNLFYSNRSEIQPGSCLQFVDFSSVYNYKPRTKLFQIGITNAFSIFGQQEMFSSSNIRQANAQISSETATYYVIQLKKLQNHLADFRNFMEDMKQILYKNQTKNKIMHRQQKLAQLLMCQNKNSMDYFFLSQNSEALQTVKLSNSPKKYKMNKVNEQIIISNTYGIAKSSKPKQSHAKQASYNTFNFNKFPLYASVSSRKHRQNSGVQELTKQESKILQLVHTMELTSRPSNSSIQRISNSKQKKQEEEGVKAEGRRNTKHRSPVAKKFLIDIHNPLFQIEYFNKSQRPSSVRSKEPSWPMTRPMSSRTRVSRPLSPSLQGGGSRRPASARVMRSNSIF